jgi:hypothetical protein
MLQTLINLAISSIIGFTIIFLTFELAWHFTVCKIGYDIKIKACMFKQVKTLIVSSIISRR